LRTSLRSIVFPFADSRAFALALHEGEQELTVPEGEQVGDGEWVLAIFEVGKKKRATAAAARGIHREAGTPPVVAFERRDWDRLIAFADAGSSTMRVATKSGEKPAAQGAPGVRASARVLVVDDDRDIREVIAAMLDAVGLTVESATSAEEALERARAQSYDLMVLDWNLPGMTGIELCRLIRRDARLSTLPVLFLTAHDSSSDVVEAFASGADDYVVKPFRAPELGARIFGLLRRARMSPAHP
jgi:two-component system phosphate regulon response regulator PhoB